MSLIVTCLPKNGHKDKCPLFDTCLARLTDGTVTGCGIPLYYAGYISKSEIVVQHTVIDGKHRQGGTEGGTEE